MADHNPNKHVIAWLNSAHSMEVSLIEVLENHAKDAAEHPEMQRRIEQHIEETRRHADQVKQCLQSLGEKPSATKSLWGALTGKVQGASTGMFSDELVKNALADYAAEHFEIACYRSLIAAAEQLGLQQVATVAQGILRDEEAMAGWLEDQIPVVTRTFLQEEAQQAR